jgi:hypothetical protein
MPRFQRTRALSIKARENELNTQLALAEASQGLIRQLRAQNQIQASQNSTINTISEVIGPIKASKPRKSRKKKNASAAAGASLSEPPIPAPKFRSILAQAKSARELRQNPIIVLMPLLTREQASWNDLPFFKETPAVTQLSRPIIRTEKEEEKESFLYTNGKISPAPLKPEPINAKSYYIHPKFFSMPRTNYKAKVNLPKDLTAPFALFKLFFPQALVKFMVTSTNEYAQ